MLHTLNVKQKTEKNIAITIKKNMYQKTQIDIALFIYFWSTDLSNIQPQSLMYLSRSGTQLTNTLSCSTWEQYLSVHLVTTYFDLVNAVLNAFLDEINYAHVGYRQTNVWEKYHSVRLRKSSGEEWLMACFK